LQDGDRRVDVLITQTQKLSFALRVQPDEPAVLTALQAQNFPVVIISSKGTQGRIYASPALTLRLNGTSLGSVNSDGRDLPVIEGDKQTLQIDIGNGTVSKALVFVPGRAIIVLLKLDSSLGGLLVNSNQDGVRLDLSDAKGRTISGVTRSGKYQFRDLKPGDYTLKSTKDGFIASQEVVTILAAKDVSKNLALNSVPTSARVTIRTLAGASVAIVGGKELGTAPQPDGSLVQDLPAGHITFEVRSPGYRNMKKSADLNLGANPDIEIPMTERLPGTLRIKRSPEDSTVTYQRREETASHNLGKDSTELPEGTYNITAQANGFGSRTESITLKAGEQTDVDLTLKPLADTAPPPTDTRPQMAKWDDRSWTMEARGARVHKGTDVAAVATTPGTVTFTVSPPRGGFRRSGLEWVVGYKKGDYFLCVIDGGRYKSYTVKAGRRDEHGNTPLQKQDKYMIEVTVTATQLIVKVLEGIEWRTLEDASMPTGVLEGKFGFQGQVRVHYFTSSQ
jgi:hypothetical protein